LALQGAEGGEKQQKRRIVFNLFIYLDFERLSSEQWTYYAVVMGFQIDLSDIGICREHFRDSNEGALPRRDYSPISNRDRPSAHNSQG
jgi:hypothetical protein